MNHLQKAESVLSHLKSSYDSEGIRLPVHLHEPDFRDTNAIQYVSECINTGWVSSAGQWVNKFEQQLSVFTGARHVIAVTNGTVALRLALHLVGVRSDDEVIVPPLSFVATCNAISHLGAIPHFVDINNRTLSLDTVKLSDRLSHIAIKRENKVYNKESGRRIAAIVPVHIFGHPADLDDLMRVSQDWNLPIVEDAAEALGSWFKDKHCGLTGSVGILSFNGNKLITTGGGGALITNDDLIAKQARHLSTTAKVSHPWEFYHDSVGWNDRMPNINAALGCAQLEKLHSRLQLKRKIYSFYSNLFSKFSYCQVIEEPTGSVSNYWLVSLRLIEQDLSEVLALRNALLASAHSQKIFLRPCWNLLSDLPMYRNCPSGSLSNAKDQVLRLISLPSSPYLLGQ
ncbi:LegC family aminotransferase [Synechococcus sp. RS9916]|uniref:LegC family aminotransferase n=1 Tax=Synechococcus sp. RS9916 TaxID=221359 RepID=UPI0000E5382E|nr:LegC family aminotransferase [Synechococcus sp. RS9916]EAU75548.1 putative aminotransferase (degT family) protein [Synechococcus sp. RS9916]